MNRRASGFSLVELMIALAVGMVVIAGVVAFTVSTVNSVGRSIGATRVMQELRGAMSVTTRELKRSGYDRDALDAIARGVAPTGYADVTINGTGDCLLMSYDRVGINDTANAPGAGEWKAFRRRVVDGRGVLQMNLRDNPPVCGADDADWIDLTSPQDISVGFPPADARDEVCPAVNGNAPNGIFCLVTKVTGDARTTVTVRAVMVRLRAELRSHPETLRGIDEKVRIRTDQLAFIP